MTRKFRRDERSPPTRAAPRIGPGRLGSGTEELMGTLSDNVWERHVVRSTRGEPDLLYIDLHLIHEVTSPQAFDGLRLSGRALPRPGLPVATLDHTVPTNPIHP